MNKLMSAGFTMALLLGASQAFAQGVPAQPGAGGNMACTPGMPNCAPAQGAQPANPAPGGGQAVNPAPMGGDQNAAKPAMPGADQNANNPSKGGGDRQNANNPPKGGGDHQNAGNPPKGGGDDQNARNDRGGGGGKGVEINVSADKKQEIHQTIIALNIAPIQPTFAINVGVAVPVSVNLTSCPAHIVDLVPDLGVVGCDFFVLADGRIVIVRPDTRLIVLVVAV
jgi:hypothetical protein